MTINEFLNNQKITNNMKIKITTIGVRRIQDRIRKTLTKKEQEKIGDVTIESMSHLIALDLQEHEDAIKQII